MYVVGFLLVLGPLVTLHELGHLLVGRWFGVRAESFSVGFGKEIAGFTDRKGTRWKLSVLPLGGYVQFQGDMNPASVPDPSAPKEEGNFQSAALWKRALIVAAGPVTNLLVALAIFFAFNLYYGKPLPVDPTDVGTVAAVTADSPAEAAGMKVGDRIVAIDGERMESWRDIQQTILLHPNRRFVITVTRGDERIALSVTAKAKRIEDGFGNSQTVGLIGVSTRDIAERYEPVGIGEAAVRSVRQCIDTVDMMITGIAQIVRGDRSFSELGGPLKIAKFSGEQMSLGLPEFITLGALISLNLAFINFLPIPALDGGHLMFYLAEAIRRKPVGPQATEWAYRTGIALVLTLMVVVTVNDLFSLPLFGS
ncbi:MAG: RIP metalloprotease RseP [Porphyrobacter sp.]|nr:RIP metalloprotease RseP [Porphyrobacter sp.]